MATEYGPPVRDVTNAWSEFSGTTAYTNLNGTARSPSAPPSSPYVTTSTAAAVDEVGFAGPSAPPDSYSNCAAYVYAAGGTKRSISITVYEGGTARSGTATVIAGQIAGWTQLFLTSPPTDWTQLSVRLTCNSTASGTATAVFVYEAYMSYSITTWRVVEGETATATDSVSVGPLGALVGPVNEAETATATDAAQVRVANLPVAATDSAVASDAVATAGALSVKVTDAAAAADPGPAWVVPPASTGVSAADGATTLDSARVIVANLSVPATDQAAAADPGPAARGVLAVGVSDAATAADPGPTLARTLSVQAVEQATAADAAALALPGQAPAPSVLDRAAVLDAATVRLPVLAAAASDAAAATDAGASAAKVAAVSVTDAVSATDAARSQLPVLAVVVADGATVTETPLVALGGPGVTLALAVADGAAAADQPSASIPRPRIYPLAALSAAPPQVYATTGGGRVHATTGRTRAVTAVSGPVIPAGTTEPDHSREGISTPAET